MAMLLTLLGRLILSALPSYAVVGTWGAISLRITGGRLLPYPEQRADFIIPARYLTASTPSSPDQTRANSTCQPDPVTRVNTNDQQSNQKKLEPSFDPLPVEPRELEAAELKHAGKEHELNVVEEVEIREHIIVDWYGPDDPANPRLTLYVLAYGIGPMLLSPLQELPSWGRNPIYIFTAFVFVVLEIPTALAKNIAGLLVLRFLGGFFASPALATGGASAFGAVCGPVLGPIVGGFAAASHGFIGGWRIPLWGLMWAASFALLMILLFLLRR
ncbi:hypothetical protein FRB94_005421 [Tulasnella sp. JGI-2019a]|nr:hypothetical protein FRB94_005421 [Tulasnella sp. JGI-2019a]KAG9028490.1 hypothetical protein FRB95_006391 [Tulasnella sp. JGI-2019a]